MFYPNIDKRENPIQVAFRTCIRFEYIIMVTHHDLLDPYAMKKGNMSIRFSM